MIEEYLVEILLSVVLLFNIGAYTVLWRRTGELYDDTDDLQRMIGDNSESIMRLFDRIFGYDEDETAEGHIAETEGELESINETLERICRKIDEVDEKRQEEHRKVQVELAKLVLKLDKSEEINIDQDDFEFGSQDLNH